MTKLMGILNVTPDSFYDQGKYIDSAIERGVQIHQEGADILDIGGESTRPGAQKVSVEQEIARVIPIIENLSKKLPIPISIDTSKPQVAEAALKAGATFINDVCGLQDPAMQALAAAAQVDACVMHMQGTPSTMQQNPSYPGGIIPHLLVWFDERINALIKQGVREKHIIIDPGIGFGKTVADNLEIIQNLPKLQALGFRVLVGVSRKSFMGKILHKTAMDLLPATLAVNTLLVQNKVDIIRVHDVHEHRDVLEMLKKMNGL